jgi:hypothetical protein
MWKLIKWIIFLAIIGAIFLVITGKEIGGKKIEDHLGPILGSKVVKESIRDIRALVGEGLKSAGEAISEDVTNEERKQLDNLVKEELKSGKPINMAPGQNALPPTVKSGIEQGTEQAPRPTFKEMEALPKTETKEPIKSLP